MWWRLPHNPSAYDDDWEDQPAQGAGYQWGLGGLLPVVLLIGSARVLIARHVELSGRYPMTLHGTNAVAFAVAGISLALFLHCHYFWGNIYNQAWFAVLGKILAACGFIGGLGILIVRVGVFGMR